MSYRRTSVCQVSRNEWPVTVVSNGRNGSASVLRVFESSHSTGCDRTGRQRPQRPKTRRSLTRSDRRLVGRSGHPRPTKFHAQRGRLRAKPRTGDPFEAIGGSSHLFAAPSDQDHRRRAFPPGQIWRTLSRSRSRPNSMLIFRATKTSSRAQVRVNSDPVVADPPLHLRIGRHRSRSYSLTGARYEHEAQQKRAS